MNRWLVEDAPNDRETRGMDRTDWSRLERC